MTTIVQSRASVFEGMQVGVEATAGTAVLANKRLLSCEIQPDAMIPEHMVSPQGYKADTDLVLEQEWTKASIKGMLAFNDILYFLASGLCTPVITTPVSATLARKWQYKPNIVGPDAITTLSVERGSSAGGEAFAYGVVTDFGIDLSGKSCDFKGEMIGQQLYDGLAPSASPTEVPLRAVSPNKLDVYVGDSVAGLTQLDTAYKASWDIKGRHKPNFVRNSSRPSFKNTVEDKLGMTAQIVVEQDNTVATGFMSNLRARKEKFARFVATGDLIETGFPYQIMITFPFKFAQPKRGDNEGVYAGTYDLKPIYDGTWGGAIEIVVITDYTTLGTSTGATRPDLLGEGSNTNTGG